MLHRPSSQRGQASLEFALAVPLLGLFVAAILIFGRLMYTHLAVMTAANDCVTTAAQATDAARAVAQGNAARERSLASYSVSQQVTTAGIVAFGNQSSRGVTTPSRYVCQVGYPVNANWAITLPGQTFELKFFSLQYTFTYVGQPYKSNWEAQP